MVQDFCPNGTGQWIAAICRPMCARGHARGCIFGGEHRAKGKSTANAFGHHHDVRRNPGPFMGKKLTRTSNPALHLIQDQKNAVFVTQFSHALEAGIWQWSDAAFALNRFENDGGRGVIYGSFKCFMISPSQLFEAG